MAPAICVRNISDSSPDVISELLILEKVDIVMESEQRDKLEI